MQIILDSFLVNIWRWEDHSSNTAKVAWAVTPFMILEAIFILCRQFFYAFIDSNYTLRNDWIILKTSLDTVILHFAFADINCFCSPESITNALYLQSYCKFLLIPQCIINPFNLPNLSVCLSVWFEAVNVNGSIENYWALKGFCRHASPPIQSTILLSSH